MTDPGSVAALHERLFTIDTHLDTPTARLLRPDWDFGEAHEVAQGGSQCDLPRMQAGGLDAAVFAAYTAQTARTPEADAIVYPHVLRVLERTRDVLAAHGTRCTLALDAAEARGIVAAGRRAIFLSLENSYPLARELDRVASLHRAGVRMLGLTHMLNNEVADASTDPRGPEWGGLSPFGREVVAECNRLGIVLDASHASDAATAQLIDLSRVPVVLSHSGCQAVCDHPRNVGDDLLRALAARGGVIQINALGTAIRRDGLAAPRDAAIADMLRRMAEAIPTPEFKAWAGGEWGRIERAYPNPGITLADYVQHVEHAVAVAGIDHVGIGCDFDGGGGVEGLNSVADYPALTAALVARGWTEADLAKLWGGNTLRVFEAVGGG